MTGCASPSGCGDPACRLCTVIAKLPQPVIREHIDASDRTRDGDQDFRLKSHDPTWTKRNRKGPLR